MKSITKLLLESLNEEEVISNNELSGELYDYMLSEVDYDIDRHGKVEYVYTPTYEQFNDNIAEISEEDFNKLRKDIEEALYRTKFYNDVDGSGYYIELNDNHTMWELSNENKTAEDWTAIVQAAAAKFEEETGVELKFLGRSGRHACVDVTADNLMGYNKLQEVQERLEQECIDEFNEEPLTESVNTNDAVSFVNEKIAFLKDNQDYDGAWLNLDDKYALVVCWEEGFDVEDPDVIHAKDNPEYALCLSIRERNEADLPSYWSLPFDKSGEPIIDSVSIRDNEDLTSTVNSLLDEYNKMITKSEENMNESEDVVARDLGIEPGSDEEATLNSLYAGVIDVDAEYKYLIWKKHRNKDGLPAKAELVTVLPSYEEASNYCKDLKKDPNLMVWIEEKEIHEFEELDIDLAGDKVMEMFNTYGLNELTFHEIENEFIEGLNTFADIMVVCADLEEKGKVTYDRDNNKIFRKMNESEEVKEEKKVTKVEVLVLPTIKFLWAEGNQDHVKALFGSAEEHDMDFSKFQNAVYVLDQEVSERNGGYDKVKYIANIQVKFTYEDGSTSEETTTYTGRVDCGDGYKYVTVSKNMKHTIQDAYKDAEVIIKEDDTAELNESDDSLRKKKLVNSIEHIVGGYYNSILDGYEKPFNTDEELVDYVYSQVFDTVADGEGTSMSETGINQDVKYLGKDFIVSEIIRIGHDNGVVANINESAAYEVDMAIEGNIEEAIEEMLKSNNAEGIQYKIVTLNGPGSGWPVVRFYGDEAKVEEFLKNIGFEDFDAYKKENKELNESEEVKGISLKDYAMNLCDGEIDKDVSDVDVDMLVAFVYNFNNTPEDNYDKFLEILGERTIVVKDNEWNLVCDFTSVFKPYEEQLRDVFDMDYSEFDEAYYEAVDNLEGLVSGMVGEKTYETLVNILNGNK